MSLTNKQAVFVAEYLKCMNASEAARRAGYSEKTAYSIGSENLRKPEVLAAIEAYLAQTRMSVGEVIARLERQSRGTIEDFGEIGAQGSFVMDLVKARDRGALGNVKKLKPTRYGHELELYDAQAALVHVGKVHGIFIDRQRIEGGLSIAHVTSDELAQARDEAVRFEKALAGQETERA